MRLHSLTTRLLLGLALSVIVSSLSVATIATERYSRVLMESLRAQARTYGESLAAEAADLVLTNDLVALQHLVDHQVKIHPDLAYMFVEYRGTVLVHSFPQGFPDELRHLHGDLPESQTDVIAVRSREGLRYLDMSVPILDGHGGRLRLGFSEEPHRAQVRRLWWQIMGLTILVLCGAVTAGSLAVRRITKPLARLTEAAGKARQGELAVRVDEDGRDEVALLGRSFNRMMERIERDTERLREQTRELDLAHRRTRTFCEVVQGIGALSSLRDVGPFVIRRLREVLHFQRGLVFLFDDTRENLTVLHEKGHRITGTREVLVWCSALLARVSQPGVHRVDDLPEEIAEMGIAEGSRRDCALVPVAARDGLPFGLFMGWCGSECRCETQPLEIAHAMLTEAAAVLKRAVHQELERRNLQARFASDKDFCGIVGKDPAMQTVFRLIEDVAASDATVLIHGESGTGKELVARAVHLKSLRRQKPFVVINCAAYPATLLESELFGHEKGAFTGANRMRVGRFEEAHGGTVFLDEVGEISASAQIKLLRVLQTRELERLGSNKTITVDVRVVAATNRDLMEEVRSGRFREDLFYRLNVIPIHLPPLRERRNDIPLLARHFLRRFAESHGKVVREFSPDVMRVFLRHPWPGNVRELENTVEHAVVLARGPRVEVSDLPAGVHDPAPGSAPSVSGLSMTDRERVAIEEALRATGGNRKEAARLLGISRSALYNKMKKHRIR
ncbi:DNA-binding transcriptional response regulator, NtrC family, contains REC, AAA-type ATPase, and a Fis-type DNA-binding domains [Desulfacinum infernum DSM 9756]|uniref:DNA-binding transcriptional response regulator, NtrC family, contains REC, AAA-type ATPase, and a Fis-type DNA-binding domains n=1 Tax=Desulfacinum infernum DSM 9756 TaxID=1121391 RepID=A0A1M4TYN2_9BACT|nr:sigma 54-interacting transcriptional regulator [Desulfacinum infernum]SHE49622.1 DNA-binding transcriptional response regulator, NtrC family, contains REC, AAA-type ATPase, and a Fis-type DNA-binding domains [Desulfacinum infernum DSM 9756]